MLLLRVAATVRVVGVEYVEYLSAASLHIVHRNPPHISELQHREDGTYLLLNARSTAAVLQIQQLMSHV
jgi:hypothetical protein